MTTRPITLRPWQVRAALDGRLRRIVVPLKVQPPDDWRPAPGLVEIHRCDAWGEPVEPLTKRDVLGMGFTEADGSRGFVMPYAPGDTLYGREVWSRSDINRYMVAYRTDGVCGACVRDGDGKPAFIKHGEVMQAGSMRGQYGLSRYGGRWRSPVTMPKWASRWTLTVGEVRVCRVEESTEEEMRDAGFKNDACGEWGCEGLVEDFADQFNADHGPGSWDANPWCVSAAVGVEARRAI